MLGHAHIMKTAGQTVCDILRQSFPGEHCDLQAHPVATPDDLRLARRFYPRLRSIAGHCVVPTAELAQSFPDLRFFTFVRDPVARCVSHYQFYRAKTKSRGDFDAWLEESANYHVRFLARTNDVARAIEILDCRVGFVGVLERFNESLVMLRRWAGEPALKIRYRSRNIATDNSIKRELLGDPATVEKIRRLHAGDYELYRHVREEVYPRQVAEYGPSLDEDVAQFEASLPCPPTISLAATLASAKRNLLYKPLARRLRRRVA